jgi:membrane protease YdiL (CAAX protease family)
MQNPFFNSQENRLRALFRVLLYIFLFIFAMGVPSLIPVDILSFLSRTVLILGLTYVMFTYVDQRAWTYAGLSINQTWGKECVAGILIASGTMGLIFLIQWQTQTLEITGYGWEGIGEKSWITPFLVFLFQMLCVGIYEELMARGYLIPNISEGLSIGKITPKYATLLAILISSSIFGLLHAGNPNSSTTAVINIILAGVMLAVPFVLTGRLALSIGIHFSWNFFQGGVFGFPVSGLENMSSIIQIQQEGADWWTGGAFGPEAGIIGVLGILLILVLTIIYIKKTEGKLEYSALFANTYSGLNPSKEAE